MLCLLLSVVFPISLLNTTVPQKKEYPWLNYLCTTSCWRKTGFVLGFLIFSINIFVPLQSNVLYLMVINWSNCQTTDLEKRSNINFSVVYFQESNSSCPFYVLSTRYNLIVHLGLIERYKLLKDLVKVAAMWWNRSLLYTVRYRPGIWKFWEICY